jgi:lipopolysaccharide/colanic/teichoic acid biosynthesis glycosyltransferase
MSAMGMVSSEGNDWVRKFDPRKRIFTGRAYFAAKRFMDYFLLLFSLPIWLPIIIVTAALIALDSPGAPVIFKQRRTGMGGRRFYMYKFRTMVANAEELKSEFAHLNELQWPDFKITNDPRITRLGRFLRRTSLDELPQLFNIVRGEMSFVGPRPTSFGPETYKLWHTHRLDVKPGLTGLWQVTGRGALEFDDRLRLDIAYVERRGIMFDLMILYKTIEAVLTQRGAK